MGAALDHKEWADPFWRLCNLYWCVDENGRKFKFRPNETQLRLLAEYHYFNVILKARQMGFTTLIDLMALDQCVFVPNYSAGIIAHNLEAAGRIFSDKIKFPWDNLPVQIREANPLTKETQSELAWANGSKIGVSVSMRSGTINFLHVSEYGKIARLYPIKAKEIRLGSFNAVHQGNYIFVESTAEGTGGDYYDLVKDAAAIRDSRAPLTPMDFKLHFYPWWKDKRYTMDPKGVVIPSHFVTYFEGLRTKHRINLTEGQRAWYAKKARSLKADSKKNHADMKQEFPAYEDEAFEAANEEKYFGAQIAAIRAEGRVREFPVLKKRTNQFWDLGLDGISVWFHQYGALQHRFVDFFKAEGKTVEEVLDDIRDFPYQHGTIYLPHDGKDRSVGSKVSAYSTLRAAFPNIPIICVPRVERKIYAINAARNILPECWFRKCEAIEVGVEHLAMYRKEWDETLGVWKDSPVHDEHSHPASAFEQFAHGWKPEHETMGVALPPAASTVGDRIAGY